MSNRSRGTELLYGRNAVAEALRGRRSLARLFVGEGSERQPRIAGLVAEAERRRLPVSRLTAGQFDQMLPGVNHQGVALESGPFPYTRLSTLLDQSGGQVLLALDHVQDPQNLGTLMRTAEATGCAGIILPDRRAAGITPAVVNASAGAVELMPVAAVANLSRALEDCKEAGYWVVALEAGKESQPIFRADIPEPALLVVGSEGKGIAPGLMRHADLRVRLPMLGKIDSLNAAVAGSIALYEILRRRDITMPSP